MQLCKCNFWENTNKKLIDGRNSLDSLNMRQLHIIQENMLMTFSSAHQGNLTYASNVSLDFISAEDRFVKFEGLAGKVPMLVR